MSCKNCTDITENAIIVTDPNDSTRCAECGRKLFLENPFINRINWDTYFRNICNAVASKSTCLSRQIGAILVKDKSIIATGYNGPARKYPHCMNCIRRTKKFKSGEGLEYCPASHAEANTIANAARMGISIINSTLYMNSSIIPCKFCAVLLVNAGIKEIVVENEIPYHDMSLDIFKYGNISIRTFEEE